jgi:hypothetical protein
LSFIQISFCHPSLNIGCLPIPVTLINLWTLSPGDGPVNHGGALTLKKVSTWEMSEILNYPGLAPETNDFREFEKTPVFGTGNTCNASGDRERKTSNETRNLGALERWSGWNRNQS